MLDTSIAFFCRTHQLLSSVIAQRQNAREKVKVVYMGQLAVRKHQTRERIFHVPVLFLHPCWKLNLGPLRDLQQLYRLRY